MFKTLKRIIDWGGEFKGKLYAESKKNRRMTNRAITTKLMPAHFLSKTIF